MGGAEQAADEPGPWQQLQAQGGETVGQAVQRAGEQQQPERPGGRAARHQQGRPQHQQQGGDEQPARLERQPQGLGGQEILQRRKEEPARPVAPPLPRSGQQMLVERRRRVPGPGHKRRRPGLHRNQPSALLDRAPQQGRLQIPVAKHPRGVCQQGRIHASHPGPAMMIVDPLERRMGLVVGHGDHAAILKLGNLGQQGGRGSDPVGDLQHRQAGVEAGGDLEGFAERNDPDPIGAESLEGCLQRRGNALDQDDDRSCADGGSATRLIFDEGPSREREQGVERAAVILAMSRDQSAERHPLPFFAWAAPVACFHALAKGGNHDVMTVTRPLDPQRPEYETLELTDPVEASPASFVFEESVAQPGDQGAGGRGVLAWTLAVLALAWVGVVGWLAGRAAEGLSGIAQALSLAAGPLALLGLAWLIFGRTRRREAERFTHSVQRMQAEARSLEQLLGVLRQRMDEEQDMLSRHAERLMRLGDEAGHRLSSVTRDFAAGSEALSRHATALDLAAESARNDIGVLLDDLPRAEASSRAMAEELRSSGREASGQAASLEAQLAAITGRAREAEDVVGGAAQRLVAHLTQIESAGAAAATRVVDAGTGASAEVDALLARTAAALSEIRRGIDEQSSAVNALIEQSAAGMGQAGQDAAERLGSRLGAAGGALDGLAARIAEQDRATAALMAGLDRQLAETDQRFVDLAAEGDLRAQAVATAINRVRRELDGLDAQQSQSGGTLEALAARTDQLRTALGALQRECSEELVGSLGAAEGGAERLLAVVQAARPDVEWLQDAAEQASSRMAQSTALLGALDAGAAGTEQKLEALRATIAATTADAGRLEAETGPALVQAMVQIQGAAQQAATRAREALASVVPETAERLSAETRAALSRAVEQCVKAELRAVEEVAGQALAAARNASEGLSQQMLNIGRTATALEQHMARTEADTRAADSEAFARRAAVLIDALHSASIDVGRILSDEVDDRAWASYLKGDRGVFTRRAVRLLTSADLRGLEQHYGGDAEFASSVTRYVHDFEAMLRRVSAEQEGGMMAVTLLSSDMGRLYAALAQVVERRR